MKGKFTALVLLPNLEAVIKGETRRPQKFAGKAIGLAHSTIYREKVGKLFGLKGKGKLKDLGPGGKKLTKGLTEPEARRKKPVREKTVRRKE